MTKAGCIPTSDVPRLRIVAGEMVNDLMRVLDQRMKPSWSIGHPEAWNAEYSRRRLAAATALDMEILTVAEAREAGWQGLPPSELVLAHAIAFRTPDGTLGIDTQDRGMQPVPSRHLRHAVSTHLEAVLRGEASFRRPNGLPRLPEICRSAIRADGLDPDGVETFAGMIGHIRLSVGGRRYTARFGFAQEPERATRQTEPVKRPPLERHAWSEVRLTIARAPRVMIDGSRVLVDIVVPDVMLNALEGRIASEVIDLPALRGYAIVEVRRRKTGFSFGVSTTK